MRHWTQATRTLICIMLLPYKETGALHRRSHMCTYHWTSSNLTIGTRVSVTVTTNRYLSATKKVCTHNSVKKKKKKSRGSVACASVQRADMLHATVQPTHIHTCMFCTHRSHIHVHCIHVHACICMYSIIHEHVLYIKHTHTCTCTKRIALIIYTLYLALISLPQLSAQQHHLFLSIRRVKIK